MQSQLDNEAIFPTRIGVPFPDNFRDICSNIFRRLFRVYGHIYHSHFESILNLGAEPHLNTCARRHTGGAGVALRARRQAAACARLASRAAGWADGWKGCRLAAGASFRTARLTVASDSADLPTASMRA